MPTIDEIRDLIARRLLQRIDPNAQTGPIGLPDSDPMIGFDSGDYGRTVRSRLQGVNPEAFTEAMQGGFPLSQNIEDRRGEGPRARYSRAIRQMLLQYPDEDPGGVTGGAFGAPGATGAAPSGAAPAVGTAPPVADQPTAPPPVADQPTTPPPVADQPTAPPPTSTPFDNPVSVTAQELANYGNPGIFGSYGPLTSGLNNSLSDIAVNASNTVPGQGNVPGFGHVGGVPAPPAEAPAPAPAQQGFGVPAVEETTTYGVPGFGPAIGGFAAPGTIPADNPAFGVPSGPQYGYDAFGPPGNYGNPNAPPASSFGNVPFSGLMSALDDPYSAFASAPPPGGLPAGLGAPPGSVNVTGLTNEQAIAAAQAAAQAAAAKGGFGPPPPPGFEVAELDDPYGSAFGDPYGGYGDPYGGGVEGYGGGVEGYGGGYGDVAGGGYGDVAGGGYGDVAGGGYGDEGAGAGGGGGSGAGGAPDSGAPDDSGDDDDSGGDDDGGGDDE